jgi:hypothetical protein
MVLAFRRPCRAACASAVILFPGMRWRGRCRCHLFSFSKSVPPTSHKTISPSEMLLTNLSRLEKAMVDSKHIDTRSIVDIADRDNVGPSLGMTSNAPNSLGA